MKQSSRVYLTRIVGLSVYDPIGDRVGKVRDIVVTLRTDASPARVLGLVVEITRGRQSFVPISRMTSVDTHAIVLSSGTVSMRRFEQRGQETLVMAQLLDREITIQESGAKAVLVDVAMEQSRTRDWLIMRVAVRDRVIGRLGPRRGHVRQLGWHDVSGISQQSGRQEANALLEEFEDQKPADVAQRIKDLPFRRRQEIAEALGDGRLADILEELPEDDQLEILAGLQEERAADVLAEMDPDDAADLLGEMSNLDRDRLLGLMEPDEAQAVEQLLHYTEDSAGGIMTSQPVILTPDTTIAEALAHVRREQISPALASLVYVARPPVATPTGKFLGVVHIQRLLREQPSELVGGIVDNELEPLRVTATLPEITRYFAAYNLVGAPVVDDTGRLIGAVTVDDLLDHLLPEDWREQDDA